MADSGKVFIRTFGCQMNVYDSEKIMAFLDDRYVQAASEDEADLILLNTCSVRDKAEQKVYSLIGRLRNLKEQNPRLIIGVGGCMAQQEGQGVLDRAPLVDLVFGTHNIEQLPELIDERILGGKRICRISDRSDHIRSPGKQTGVPSPSPVRLVTIMKGCDNSCTYCIVPQVRGAEISRHSSDILDEVRSLVACGAREITLLGQNVNSYKDPGGGAGFIDLLEKVDAVKGLMRLRFVTSHPKDFSPELAGAMAGLQTVCEHIHLPIQAASNRVLNGMKRGYNRDEYLEKVEVLRELVPGVELTTDLIVGFPTEERKDFEETLSLLEKVRYQNAFSFRFSPRPGTEAAGMVDSVPPALKKNWLPELQSLQSTITSEKHSHLEGQEMEVLVEGTGKRENGMLEGRTRNNFIIHFPGDPSFIGSLLKVRVTRSRKIHLEGEVIE